MSEFHEQPCWSCQRYCGGCPWTEVLPDGKIRFEPVPGWVAKEVVVNQALNPFTSYEIHFCPMYKKMESQNPEHVSFGNASKTKMEAYKLFKQGRSVSYIARILCTPKQTIEKYAKQMGFESEGV